MGVPAHFTIKNRYFHTPLLTQHNHLFIPPTNLLGYPTTPSLARPNLCSVVYVSICHSFVPLAYLAFMNPDNDYSVLFDGVLIVWRDPKKDLVDGRKVPKNSKRLRRMFASYSQRPLPLTEIKHAFSSFPHRDSRRDFLTLHGRYWPRHRLSIRTSRHHPQPSPSLPHSRLLPLAIHNANLSTTLDVAQPSSSTKNTRIHRALPC